MSSDVVHAAQAHALQEYPKESCGLVVNGAYVPMENTALPVEQHQGESGCTCQLCSFQIDPAAQLAATADHPLQAVLHSHPDGPMFPSSADMSGQLASKVPWGIIATDGERASHPIWFGDEVGIAPIIGREFVHGAADCYKLVRDIFALGKDALEAEGVTKEWPFDPIILPEFARDDSWWDKNQDLYLNHFEEAGFKRIDRSEVRPGDCFLSKIRSDKVNHAGAYVGNNLICHHLVTRPSRREPAGIWAHGAEFWVRYVGVDNA
ncbi:MAG: Mov34/MPN/PAD-1 family protein [Roseibium sp.]|nr:Mov34/MPN/PAD-1 family protein [Roseibium sp.]